MTVAVRVRVTVTGHRRSGIGEHDLALALPDGPVNAHQIIEAAVRAEIAAYQARTEEATLVRVLTVASLADAQERGAVRGGDGPPAAPVDIPAAVETARQAFDDGIFKIFVGDDEIAGRDERWLADGATLLFLRLVPLAGG
jgi:hypothetical protein